MQLPNYSALSYSSDRVVPPTTNNFAVYIHNRMVARMPKGESEEQRVCRRVLQGVALSAGPLARLSFMEVPLKFAGDNKALGGLLVYGNTASYGSLISWCLLKMVNSATTPMSAEEKALSQSSLTPFCRTLLKIAVFVVGELAQIPFGYIVFIYNERNYFYPLSVFLIDAAYPIYSLTLTTEEIVKRRRLSEFEKKLYLMKLKLITQLQRASTAILHSERSNGKVYLDRLQAIDQTPNLQYIDKVKHYIQILLSSVSLQPEQPPDSLRVKSGRIVFYGLGMALGFTQIYFAETLSYGAAKEMTEDPGGRAVIAGSVTVCNAYLGLKIFVQSAAKLYNFAINRLLSRDTRSVAEILQPKLTVCLQLIALITVSLSFSAPLQVAKDNFEGDFGTYMEVTAVMEAVILSSFALSELIDELITYQSLNASDEYTRQLAEITMQINELNNLIEKSPMMEFVQMLDLLPESQISEWKTGLQITSENLQQYIAKAPSVVEFARPRALPLPQDSPDSVVFPV